MADSSPAFATVTPNDHSAGLIVTTIILILFSGIVVIAKTLMRYRTSKIASLDNLAIFSALILAIAQSIAVQVAVNHGLGTHQRSVSHSDFVSYSKANYAAQILYVLVLACSKFSVTQLVQAVQPQRWLLLATRGLEGLIGLWTFSSVFALAFGCHLPGPWLIGSDRCSSLEGVYDYVGVMNVLTDIALIAIPIAMLWKIQITSHKKLLVIGLFAARLLVPAITIVQLVYFSQYFDALDDQTWSNTNSSIVTQVVMNMSIITACIPSLRRMVTELRTDQTCVAVSEGLELSTGKFQTNGSAALRSMQKSEEKENGLTIPFGHNAPHDKSMLRLSHNSSGKKSSAWRVGWSQERLRDTMLTTDYAVEEDNYVTNSSDGASSM